MSQQFGNAPFGLVRDFQITSHRPKHVLLNLGRDLYPALRWDTRSFGIEAVPADARSPSRSQESIGTEEGHQWQIDDVYYA